MKLNTSERAKSLFKTCFIISLLLSITAIIFQTILYLSEYDTEKMLYENSSRVWFYAGFVALCSIFFGLTMLLLRTDTAVRSLPRASRGLSLANALCGFFLLATIVMQVLYNLNGLDVGKYTGSLHTVALIMAVPASFYFLYTALADKIIESLKAFFGVTLTVWCILCLLVTHFYMLTPLNSPIRIGSLMSFSVMMLFFCEEIRFHINRAIPNVYFGLGFATMLFAGANSIPILILSFANKFELNVSTIYSCFEAAAGLYAGLRMFTFFKNGFEDKPKEEINENEDASDSEKDENSTFAVENAGHNNNN